MKKTHKNKICMIISIVISLSFLLAGCSRAADSMNNDSETTPQAQVTVNEEETAGVAEENSTKAYESTNGIVIDTTTDGRPTEQEGTSSKETSTEEVEPTAQTAITQIPTTTKKQDTVTITTKRATEKITATKKSEVTTTKKKTETLTTTKKKTETKTDAVVETTINRAEQTTTVSNKIRVGTNEQKLWVLDGINNARRESGKWEVPRQLDPYLTAQAQAYAEKLAKENEGHAVHSDWGTEGVAVNWIFLEEPKEQWVGHGEMMCMHVGGFVEGLYFGVGIAAASDGTTYTVVQSAGSICKCYCDSCSDGGDADSCSYKTKYIVAGDYDEWSDKGGYFPDISSAEEYVWAGYPYVDYLNGIFSTTDFIKI